MTGIGEGRENVLEIRIPKIKGRIYTVAIYYANGEVLGTHPYNVNLVDRFSVVEINEEKRRSIFLGILIVLRLLKLLLFIAN